MSQFHREEPALKRTRTVRTTLLEVMARLSESMTERRATSAVVDLIRSGRVHAADGTALEVGPDPRGEKRPIAERPAEQAPRRGARS